LSVGAWLEPFSSLLPFFFPWMIPASLGIVPLVSRAYVPAFPFFFSPPFTDLCLFDVLSSLFSPTYWCARKDRSLFFSFPPTLGNRSPECTHKYCFCCEPFFSFLRQGSAHTYLDVSLFFPPSLFFFVRPQVCIAGW